MIMTYVLESDKELLNNILIVNYCYARFYDRIRGPSNAVTVIR